MCLRAVTGDYLTPSKQRGSDTMRADEKTLVWFPFRPNVMFVRYFGQMGVISV